MEFPILLFLGFICFAACFCKLVAAGCILKSAANAGKPFDCKLRIGSLKQRTDGFEIAVAAVREHNIVQFSVDNVKIDHRGTCSAGLVSVMHKFLLSGTEHHPFAGLRPGFFLHLYFTIKQGALAMQVR